MPNDLVARVGADIDDFLSKTKRARREWENFGSEMRDIGARMTVAVSAPLAGLGLISLKVAGQLEQAQIGFTTLLGSAQKAGTFLESLRQFALQTPFEFPELLEASKRLTALGFASKEVIPIMTDLGDAVAALGGNKDLLDRMIFDIGHMRETGVATSREMRQFAMAGIPAWESLAKALGITIPEAMERVEKKAISSTEAINAILKGIHERFGGLMAAQMKSLFGIWSNFKDQVTYTLTNLGTALLPIAKGIVTNVLTPMLESVNELTRSFAGLPTVMQASIITLGGLAVLLPPLTAGLGLFFSTIAKHPMIVAFSAALSVVAFFISQISSDIMRLIGQFRMLQRASEITGKSKLSLLGMSGAELDALVAAYDELPKALNKRGPTFDQAQELLSDLRKKTEEDAAKLFQALRALGVHGAREMADYAKNLDLLRQKRKEGAVTADELAQAERGFLKLQRESSLEWHSMSELGIKASATLQEHAQALGIVSAAHQGGRASMAEYAQGLESFIRTAAATDPRFQSMADQLENLPKLLKSGRVSLDEYTISLEQIASGAFVFVKDFGEAAKFSDSFANAVRRARAETLNFAEANATLRTALERLRKERQIQESMAPPGTGIGGGIFKIGTHEGGAGANVAMPRPFGAPTLEDLGRGRQLAEEFQAIVDLNREVAKDEAFRRLADQGNAATDSLRRLREAFQALGIVSTETLEKSTRDAQFNYQTIAESSETSARSRLEAEIRVHEATIALARDRASALTGVDRRRAEDEIRGLERLLDVDKKTLDKMLGHHTSAWQIFARQISTVLTDLSRGIVDILFPRSTRQAGASPAVQEAQALFDALKSAADKFASQGRSQPVAALESLVKRIQEAGSEAEASAIALRYFGQSGIELAARIRRSSTEVAGLLAELRATYPLARRAQQGLDDLAKEEGKLGKLKGVLGEIGRAMARLGIETIFHTEAMKNAFKRLLDVVVRLLDRLTELIFGGRIHDIIFGPHPLPSGAGRGTAANVAKMDAKVAQASVEMATVAAKIARFSADTPLANMKAGVVNLAGAVVNLVGLKLPSGEGGGGGGWLGGLFAGLGAVLGGIFGGGHGGANPFGLPEGGTKGGPQLPPFDQKTVEPMLRAAEEAFRAFAAPVPSASTSFGVPLAAGTGGLTVNLDVNFESGSRIPDGPELDRFLNAMTSRLVGLRIRPRRLL